MRKTLAIAAVGLMSLGFVAACGDDDDDAPTDAPTEDSGAPVDTGTPTS